MEPVGRPWPRRILTRKPMIWVGSVVLVLAILGGVAIKSIKGPFYGDPSTPAGIVNGLLPELRVATYRCTEARGGAAHVSIGPDAIGLMTYVIEGTDGKNEDRRFGPGTVYFDDGDWRYDSAVGMHERGDLPNRRAVAVRLFVLPGAQEAELIPKGSDPEATVFPGRNFYTLYKDSSTGYRWTGYRWLGKTATPCTP